tara:strand:+ start:3844 stop:4800 length:957 start_codon:yes stop_codon:yes gene_type:complete
MGGMLSPRHTKQTRLTPEVAKSALIAYRSLIYGWNRHLENNAMKPVTYGCPVGSTMHINDDLINNPDIEYGDVDCLVTLPFPESYGSDWTERKARELKIEKEYKASFREYIQVQEDERIVANLDMMVVIQTPHDHNVQVDMITTFPLYFEWMRRRYGPEQGKKGYLFGCLYSALGDVLTLSFGTSGAQARIKNGTRVEGNKRKEVIFDKISVNPVSFMSDTLYYLTEQYSNALYVNDDKLSSLMNSIVRFCNILDDDGTCFTANKVLKKYESNLWKQLNKKETLSNKKGFPMTPLQVEDFTFDIYAALAQYEEEKSNQ